MTKYKEILRLFGLRLNNTQIAESCGCSRTTVISVLQKAQGKGLRYRTASALLDKELLKRLFSNETPKAAYKISAYDYVHREMAKSGVNLSLLWLKYCG